MKLKIKNFSTTDQYEIKVSLFKFLFSKKPIIALLVVAGMMIQSQFVPNYSFLGLTSKTSIYVFFLVGIFLIINMYKKSIFKKNIKLSMSKANEKSLLLYAFLGRLIKSSAEYKKRSISK